MYLEKVEEWWGDVWKWTKGKWEFKVIEEPGTNEYISIVQEWSEPVFTYRGRNKETVTSIGLEHFSKYSGARVA